MDVTPCRLRLVPNGRGTVENQREPLGGRNVVGESLGYLLY